MRAFLAVFALAAFGLLVISGTNNAGDKKETKEVVLKGKITCNKCDLGKSTDCETVIVVKQKDKDMVYWFDAKSDKKYHGKVCTESKNGTVTGTIKDDEKDAKKKIITVKKVEFDK
jgi:hypothetical protein